MRVDFSNPRLETTRCTKARRSSMLNTFPPFEMLI